MIMVVTGILGGGRYKTYWFQTIGGLPGCFCFIFFIFFLILISCVVTCGCSRDPLFYEVSQVFSSSPLVLKVHRFLSLQSLKRQHLLCSIPPAYVQSLLYLKNIIPSHLSKKTTPAVSTVINMGDAIGSGNVILVYIYQCDTVYSDR